MITELHVRIRHGVSAKKKVPVIPETKGGAS
jgi:hypothetical protein